MGLRISFTYNQQGYAFDLILKGSATATPDLKIGDDSYLIVGDFEKVAVIRKLFQNLQITAIPDESALRAFLSRSGISNLSVQERVEDIATPITKQSVTLSEEEKIYDALKNQPNGPEIIRRIREFDATSSNSLSLFNCQLTDSSLAILFPLLKKRAAHLTELNLGNNRITKLPESIGDLKGLSEFYLSGNQITTVPESFGALKNLKTLDLSCNQLAKLPNSFGNLTKLVHVLLATNRLQTLPDSFINLKKLSQLDLKNNQLTRLPSNFGDLEKLSMIELQNNPQLLNVKQQVTPLIDRGVHVSYDKPDPTKEAADFVVTEILANATKEMIEDYGMLLADMMGFVCAKAIYIYTLGDKRDAPLPDFFKPETKKAIVGLRGDLQKKYPLSGDEKASLVSRMKNLKRYSVKFPDNPKYQNAKALYGELRRIAFHEEGKSDNLSHLLKCSGAACERLLPKSQ